MFHTDFAKVDRDVAMVVHVCCKRLFPMFHLFFRRMLQVCLSGCCICFTHMLQVFCLDVANACNGFRVFFSCFCKCFRGIFLLNVNVNEQRFGKPLLCFIDLIEYVHVKGCVQRTQPMGEVTSRHQETCLFSDTVNY